MKAELLLNERHQVKTEAFVELKIWCVSISVKGSQHQYKYSLAYVVQGECVLRYDNEAGKGDHRHIGVVESAYSFTTPEQLLADFWSDVDKWRDE
jgi:hypothetical protein